MKGQGGQGKIEIRKFKTKLTLRNFKANYKIQDQNEKFYDNNNYTQISQFCLEFSLRYFKAYYKI